MTTKNYAYFWNVERQMALRRRSLSIFVDGICSRRTTTIVAAAAEALLCELGFKQ